MGDRAGDLAVPGDRSPAGLLAVHPAYFRLTGGIERWLYRLARKAVPEKVNQPEIRFRLETLFEISGLTGRLRDFRNVLERIADEAPLPEYGARIKHNGQHELVTLYRDYMKPGRMPRSMTAGEHVGQVPARVATHQRPVKEMPVTSKTTTWSISDAVIETREGRTVLIFPDGTSLLWR